MTNNEGTDVTDYAGEGDADVEKENEGEEYATIDSDSQKVSDCSLVFFVMFCGL